MDDQQTYLLNGLLTRQYDLGRIVRFRQVARGRQASTYELLTSEQNEFLVQMYSPAFNAEQLDFSARAVNVLEVNRFSVMAMRPTKSGALVAEGPQGSHMLVSASPAGSILPSDQYTSHDISQVGLRLGWMHRLLREQLEQPAQAIPLALQVETLFAEPTAETSRYLPPVPLDLRQRLVSQLQIPVPILNSWVHGDITSAALLHDADHQLRTVVDWGLLHFGSPLEDVVDAFLSLCVQNDGVYSIARGRILLEAYESLVPLANLPWTPIVATWCGQRLIDAARGQRALPKHFASILAAPERLATAMASGG